MYSIKIKERDYPYKYGLKVELRLEREKGITLGVDTLGTEATLYLHYYALELGAKIEGKPLDITFDQFIDICDEHPDIIAKLGDSLRESYTEKKT